MILDILLTGQTISVLQLSTKPVYSMYGGKRISELREKGINIKDWSESLGNNILNPIFQ